MLDPAGTCVAVGWSDCPQGFTKDPSGWGCAPIIATACDAGSMPRLGDETCSPVGWRTCTAGFAPADGGWGCDAVLPVFQRDGGPACFGATRETLGSTDCVPIGDCSDAGFPPAAATIFVDDSFATVDATHFRTISAAIATAQPGSTIAIESGTYAERVAPNRSVNLVGRCPATVRIAADGGTPALRVGSPIDVGIERLTITGGFLAMELDMGARVTGKNLVLQGNRRIAIRVLDAPTRLTLEESIIRGTLADPANGSYGIGIAAGGGAQLTLTDVALISNREMGIYLEDPTTHVEGTRVLLASTLPRASTGQQGFGILVQGGSTLDIHGAALVNNQAVGLLVAETGSRATLTDFVIRGTKPGLDSLGAPLAINASARMGGRVELTSGALLDSSQQALNVDGAGARATLTNTVVRGLNPVVTSAARAIDVSNGANATLSHVAITGIGAEGLSALGGTASLDDVYFSELSSIAVRSQTGGNVSGNHVTIERATSAGVISMDMGRVVLTDCAVLGTRLGPAASGGQVGYGAISQSGATASFERCLFDGNVAAGLYAPGGSLAATATVVRGTLADANGEYGQGAVAERGGAINLQRALFDRNRVSGLQSADAPSNILAIETIVRDTQPDATGKRGRGANAQFGATLSAFKSAFLGNRQVGVFAFQSKVVLEDVLVLGTLADPDGAYGNGIEALTDGDIAMTRGAIDSSAGIGAVFAEGAGLLDAVRVLNNAVGVHTQDGVMLLEVETPPAMRGTRDLAITRSTIFEGNATRVGMGQVAVPMP